MLDITFKVHESNLLRLEITYQSERRESRSDSAKYFYDDGDIRIISTGRPEVNGYTIFLRGVCIESDNEVLRFPNFKIFKKFFEALRTCTGNLRVEL